MFKNRGFTLLEILLVVALIAILAAALYVALKPAERLSETNNAQRWTNATAMLNAVLNFTVDNNGALPTGIDIDYTNAQVLGTDVAGCNSGCGAVTTVAACLDLSADLVTNGYIAAIPTDPKTGTAGFTDYYLQLESNGAITVGACDPDAEGGSTPVIRVQR